MEIAIISNLYPPYVLGGYEILCANVVEEFKKLGHNVFVLTSSHGISGTLQEKGISRKLKLYAPFTRAAQRERRNRKNTYRHNYRTARALLKENRPDIVFVWSQLRLTTGAAMAAQDLNIPVAFTMNDTHLRSYAPSTSLCPPRKAIRTLLDATVDREITLQNLNLTHVTGISRHLIDELQDNGVPVPYAEVIYQGIPIEQFPIKQENPAWLHHSIRLLYAGQLHAYKGVHKALTALEQLNRDTPNKFELTLAGTGPQSYIDRLHNLAAELGLGDSLTFAGALTQDRLASLYRESDILLVTSLWEEPFGLTHLEAMASGTPVISTFRGGMKEFLIHEENCLTFDPDSPGGLTREIQKMAADQPLRERLIKNARAMVENKFTTKRYTRDLAAFLERTIQTG